MYTVYIKLGIVVRTADGVQVMPANNPSNPNPPEHVAYLDWLRQGNSPTPDMRDPRVLIVDRAKETRDLLLESLIVTVGDLEFNANDLSQARIGTAIRNMKDGELCTWIMADNSLREVSKETLIQVGKLAWAKTSVLCVAPHLESTVNPVPPPVGGV